MNNESSPQKYYLSLGAGSRMCSFGLSTSWKDLTTNNGFIGEDGYWLIILNRSDPGGAKYVNKIIRDSKHLLPTIKSTVEAHPDNCILLVMGMTHKIQTWGWDLDFMSEFAKYGAGDVYWSIVQNSLLLSGTSRIAQYVYYCLACIPSNDTEQGFEAGCVSAYWADGKPTNGLSETVALALQLDPVVLPTGTTYSMRLIGA